MMMQRAVVRQRIAWREREPSRLQRRMQGAAASEQQEKRCHMRILAHCPNAPSDCQL